MGWVGFDLDGTLAIETEWRGPEAIGEPIPEMVALAQALVLQGRDVRIFTARAALPEAIPPIVAWCERHIGRRLPVTCVKDWEMDFFYDDRAVSVERNTGRIVSESHSAT